MTATRDRFPQSPMSELTLRQDGVAWQWYSNQGLPFLTCSLLERWPHGFFTRHFSPRTPASLVETLPPPIPEKAVPVYHVKQVHGNRVLQTSEVKPESPGDGNEAMPSPEADGLLTDQEGESVWVCTADCVPVLVADTETGRVAAIHAGWRGTATRIVPQVVSLLEAGGSQLANLRIAMGPAISGEVYQVSTDVAAQVCATLMPGDEGREEVILDFARQLPTPPVLPDAEAGKVRLDVRGVNALQLAQLGIEATQIAMAPFCTFSNAEHFFSYRRDQLKKVQWSGIVSNRGKLEA